MGQRSSLTDFVHTKERKMNTLGKDGRGQGLIEYMIFILPVGCLLCCGLYFLGPIAVGIVKAAFTGNVGAIMIVLAVLVVLAVIGWLMFVRTWRRSHGSYTFRFDLRPADAQQPQSQNEWLKAAMTGGQPQKVEKDPDQSGQKEE